MRFLLLPVCMIMLFSCNDQKEKNSTTGTNTATATTTSSPPAATTAENPQPSSGGTGLIGTWKMNTEIFDDNGNRIIDEEERKKAYGNKYVLQLNDGGTCKIQGVYSGRWETKTDKGYPMLYVYRKKIEGEETTDPAPDIYGIVQMDNTDLILQVIEAGQPSSFWLFKRQ